VKTRAPTLRQLAVVALIVATTASVGFGRASAETAEEPPEHIPDVVFARMVENPVSGITRVPLANATQFGIPPNKRVSNALVLAPIIPALFKNGWSIITRTTIPVVVTVPFEELVRVEVFAVHPSEKPDEYCEPGRVRPRPSFFSAPWDRPRAKARYRWPAPRRRPPRRSCRSSSFPFPVCGICFEAARAVRRQS